MSYATRSIGEVSSPAALEALEFRGEATEDVTAFLGAVRRVAMMNNRQSDNEWLITYLESCLRGDAMRWFDEMDVGATITNWSSLRRLFLNRFDKRDIHPATPPAPVAEATVRRPDQEAPKAPLSVTVGATAVNWALLRRFFLNRFDTRDAHLSTPPTPVVAVAVERPEQEAPKSPLTVRYAHPATPPTPAAAVAIRRPELEAPKAQLPVTVGADFGAYKAKGLYKKLIVGNSGVGKSCLLSRHLGYGWVPSSIPTSGIHFEVQHLVVADGHFSIKDAFWDVSGTDEWRSQLGPYCTGIDVVWIVYDVTDQKSFQDVKRWFDLIMQYRSSTRGLILIGNKRDLYDRRVVQKQQGHDLAKALGIPKFFETSARTNEGVQEMRGDHLLVLCHNKG
ncbi:GTP-binding protein [Tulasnella sp. JGI-2019a]|nr:GTP-binding protein [Tulasnella sp. JGI-2019a]